jgi:hypothetical protein
MMQLHLLSDAKKIDFCFGFQFHVSTLPKASKIHLGMELGVNIWSELRIIPPGRSPTRSNHIDPRTRSMTNGLTEANISLSK